MACWSDSKVFLTHHHSRGIWIQRACLIPCYQVIDLRAECKRRGLPVSGLKADLVARLQAENDSPYAHAYTPSGKIHARPRITSTRPRGSPRRLSIKVIMLVGLLSVAVGFWLQIPPLREPSLYESALLQQTTEREVGRA